MIGEDEILFLDLGPVFKDWERQIGGFFEELLTVN
jgi:hypothetical protein